MIKHLSYLFFVFILCLFSCEKETEQSFCEIKKQNDTYEYPIKPGNYEWEQLDSKEKIDACQIPVDILSVISTEGLIESVLSNPLFGEIYLSNVNIQYGFNVFYKNFNGIRNLILRDDAAEKLLNRYKQMNPTCSQNNWPSLTGHGSNNNYAFSFIEIIIAQYSILTQIKDSGEMNAILQKIINKYDDKFLNGYSIVGLQYSMLICGRIMYLCNYAPFIDEYSNNECINFFINGAFLVDLDTLDIINDYVKKFLIQNE